MVSARPLVSVIVPVFNVEGFVGPCLASLLAQTLTDFEAIVVDDGSTDLSHDVALATIDGDPRFRLIRRANGGLSAARNTGLALARGEFVAFLDGDDTVEPDWLAAMVQALREQGGDWVATALTYVNLDGREVVHPAIHGMSMPNEPLVLRFSLKTWPDVIRHFPSAWNKLYRRAFIGDLRFDEGTLYEDHAFFWQLAAKSADLLWLSRPLYRQTQGRPLQITRDGSERVFDQISVLDRLAEIVAETPHRAQGRAALAQIATRLTWERSLTISHPDRRARFIAAARGWMQRFDLVPDASWDPTLPRAWALVLSGVLPLSVSVAFSADDLVNAENKGLAALAAKLSATLGALATSHFRDFEVLIALPESGPLSKLSHSALIASVQAKNAAPLPAFRRIGFDRPESHDAADLEGSVRKAVLAAAEGRLVCFLRAGEAPPPETLATWVESLLRSGAVFGFSAEKAQPGDDQSVETGAPSPWALTTTLQKPKSRQTLWAHALSARILNPSALAGELTGRLGIIPCKAQV